MSKNKTWISPNWPAPKNVHALITTRQGGVSLAPFDSLNLGVHVEDELAHVVQNRAILRSSLPSEPIWLNQTHSTVVLDLKADTPQQQDADAAISRESKVVAVVMTADCLPVLLCDKAGTVVGAAHAGWRGLCDGVIEATVQAMQIAPDQIMAYLGPAIGVKAFEVGREVRAAFMQQDPQAEKCFVTGKAEGKYFADIYALAKQRLSRLGIQAVYGGEDCTFTDQARFFSYRRDQKTGRMASLIWLA